jgi:hypothetical protein
VRRPWVLALPLAIACLAACGNDGPGQVDDHGTLTVINRTTAQVTLASGSREIRVQACQEDTVSDFTINWWTLTSPGRDTFHSGGGAYGPASFLVVTDVVSQVDARPDPLPDCEGLLQSGDRGSAG